MSGDASETDGVSPLADSAVERARYQRVKLHFDRVAELPHDEQAAALEVLKQLDAEVAREVIELLVADETLDAPSLEAVRLDREVDDFRLLERIGTGGMGEVFLAEQLRPVRRRVALKLVRPGFDSSEVLARFEGERQALALMDHPSIATVFDAGTTSDGRPYFVMEYVAGQPITQYCDERHFDQHQRIELMRQVCEGVAHAHLKGIIHRDLKPSNVLVSEQAGEPRVKIIDFGIAKAVAQRLTERTLHTEVGRVVGTPEYMSPEQASASPLDVDVRTDVYSLGVMLYELLVGVRPFEGDLGTSGFEEMRRRLSEEEPLRPSTRVSSLGVSREELWRSRSTSAERWARLLRGDLDWICLKALERDRARRYQSVADLSEDLRRTTTHEPVLAGPPSLLYRAGKFARRHRAAVVAAGLVMLVVALAVLGILVSLRRAVVAEQRAVAEADAANQVSEFLVDTFRLVDPTRRPEDPVDASELLERGVNKVREDLEDQPLVKARLLDAFGEIYTNLGQFEEAEVLAEAAGLIETRLGTSDPRLAGTLTNLSQLRFSQGRYEEAEALVRRALDLRREASDPSGQDGVIETMSSLATVLIRRERFDEAEGVLREAIARTTDLRGKDSWELAQLYNNLGLIDFERGDHAGTAQKFERALGLARKHLDGDHPWLASMLNNLGGLYFALERYEEGVPALRESVAIRERLLPPDHPDLALALTNLGQAETVLGNYAAAERLLERGQEILVRSGAEPQFLAQVELNYGLLYREQGLWDQAIEHYRRAVLQRSETLGPQSDAVGEALFELAVALDGAGEVQEAKLVRRRAEEILVARESVPESTEAKSENEVPG